MESDEQVGKGIMAWQKDVPYDTRQLAIKDALTAVKGCLTKLKQGDIKCFDLSFRSKKAPSQSFKVNPKALNGEKFSIFINRLKKNSQLRIHKRDVHKWLEDGTVDGEFTVLRTCQGKKWYVCLPRSRSEEVPVYHLASYQNVFLDPGVRSFQTFYSPEGVCGKIGGEALNRELKALSSRHDKLWSVAYTPGSVGSKTKNRLLKRCAVIRSTIKNKVDDLHNQTCSFLGKNFQNVFLPEFKVSDMVIKDRSLGSKITRKMLQLSHGAFREKILSYAKAKGFNVFLVREDYTTKTCTRCGNQKVMGGLETYRCEKCNLTIDRDYNGARNICLLVSSQFL
jgi:putative transposase